MDPPERRIHSHMRAYTVVATRSPHFPPVEEEEEWDSIAVETATGPQIPQMRT